MQANIPSQYKPPVQPTRATPQLTGSLRPRREYESYVAAATGIALIVLLVVGTAVYAGIHALFSPAVSAVTSRAVILLDSAAPDRLFALDAVILTIIGLLAVVGAAGPSRRDSRVVRNH
jgi:uncharacterized membrane protein